MSTTTTASRTRTSEEELPQRRLRLEVVAVYHRPQAHRSAVSVLHHRVLLRGRRVRRGHASESAVPQWPVFEHDTYNKLFTMHGIIMVFFFLVPSIPATLGNFLIPIMIGARDLAFPRINLLSWYIYIVGGDLRARSRSCGAASIPAGPSMRPSVQPIPIPT